MLGSSVHRINPLAEFPEGGQTQDISNNLAWQASPPPPNVHPSCLGSELFARPKNVASPNSSNTALTLSSPMLVLNTLQSLRKTSGTYRIVCNQMGTIQGFQCPHVAQ